MPSPDIIDEKGKRILAAFRHHSPAAGFLEDFSPEALIPLGRLR
jgi:hypothetical protein